MEARVGGMVCTPRCCTHGGVALITPCGEECRLCLAPLSNRMQSRRCSRGSCQKAPRDHRRRMAAMEASGTQAPPCALWALAGNPPGHEARSIRLAQAQELPQDSCDGQAAFAGFLCNTAEANMSSSLGIYQPRHSCMASPCAAGLGSMVTQSSGSIHTPVALCCAPPIRCQYCKGCINVQLFTPSDESLAQSGSCGRGSRVPGRCLVAAEGRD